MPYFLSVAAQAAGLGQAILPTPPPVPAGELAAAVVRDLGLQTVLPRLRPDGYELRLPDIVLWVGVALGLALLAYWLKDLRWRWRWRWRRRPVAEAGAAAGEAAEGTDDHLARAKRFAAEGMFATGIHEILLAAFREVRERADGAVGDSLTGREIVRRAPLDEAGRACLGELVSRVEWTYFGTRAASGEDWQVCLERFETLRGALARSGEGR